MAVTASDGTVIFFDTTSWSALQMLQPGPQGQSHLYRCLFSPDGETCASLRLRRARRIGQTFLADRYEILV